MASPRSHRQPLANLFDAASVPIYVLDDQRRVVYCNPACATWLGVTVADVIGVTCSYHSVPAHDAFPSVGNSPAEHPVGPGRAALATWLCPPPEVFAGETTTACVGRGGTEGPGSRRHARFVSLGENAAECVGVLAVVGAEMDERSAARKSPADDDARVLHEQLRAFHEQQARYFHLDRLVGNSLRMRQVREQVRIAMQTRCRTLICGPRGIGREHIARTIFHANSPESTATLMPLDCSLLDAELLASTMTSHLRGWAELSRDTSLTILLLEVDQLPLDAQAELAGYLAIHELPLRTLATSSRSLLPLVEAGEFRQDLALAVSPLVIDVPPLVSRREDIPLLAQYLLEDHNRRGGRQLSGFESETLERLTSYAWPGNTDELAEVVRQACRRAEGTRVAAADLPTRFHHAMDAAAHVRMPEEKIQLDKFLADMEAELIRRALQRAGGNKAQAARLLGVSRARLLRKLGERGAES